MYVICTFESVAGRCPYLCLRILQETGKCMHQVGLSQIRSYSCLKLQGRGDEGEVGERDKAHVYRGGGRGDEGEGETR